MAVAFCYHQTSHIQVDTVKVSIEKLPEEFNDFTIIQITDLHGKCFGQNQSHLLNLMDKKHFDILVLTGDMFRDNDEKNSLCVLRHIINYVHSKEKAVYFVAGNHDLDGDYDYISRTLQQWGVHVLDNRSVTIKRKDAMIHIIGIKDALFGMANLDAAVKNVNKGIKILLAHTIFKRGDKSLFQKIKHMKIDLVLSGHTHGFQINLFPFYVTGEGLFPKYVKGLHRIQQSYIYISRGLVTSGVHLRLFSRPELTFIQLESA
ncbi:MAG: metallophosphoesterase [Bacillota bacterium]|nr:metallophosphoesterase [Bacillota bacterium]